MCPIEMKIPKKSSLISQYFPVTPTDLHWSLLSLMQWEGGRSTCAVPEPSSNPDAVCKHLFRPSCSDSPRLYCTWKRNDSHFQAAMCPWNAPIWRLQCWLGTTCFKWLVITFAKHQWEETNGSGIVLAGEDASPFPTHNFSAIAFLYALST